MDERQARLPVVRPARYPTPASPTQALVTTATRGAVLMAAGAIARFLLKQAVNRMFAPRATKAVVPTPPETRVTTSEQSTAVVEEVIYYRRTLYRR